MFRRIYLICISLALFASCQKGEDGPSVELEGQPVKFNLSIAGAAATRATDNLWAKDDGVGIYMIPYVETVDAPADFTTYTGSWNKEYKATTDGVATDLVAVEDYLRYPADGSSVSFVAYYPYLEDLETEVTGEGAHAAHVYPVDVTEQSDLTAIDLLYIDTKGGQQYVKDDGVTMEFKHQLSKLIVTLSDEISEDTDFENAGLSIDGVPTTAKFNLSTGKLVNLDDKINPITFNEEKQVESNSVTWKAIIVPHDAEDYPDRELLISLDGKQYSVLLPNEVDFEPGYEYTFRCKFISINEQLIVELTNQNTIAPWNSHQDDGGNVKEYSPLPAETLAETEVEDGLTNCYIVAPGGHVGISVKRAYKYESGNVTNKLRTTNEDYTGEFGADIVWQTEKVARVFSVDGSGNNAVLSFYTHNKEGNAVVRVYKKDDPGKAVWSWHIWVTDYNPNTNLWNPKNNGGTTVRTVEFMDRNLGALEAANSLRGRGLHYQWGRKDPFPLKDGIATPIDGPVSVETAIQHPSEFYTIIYTINDGDWTTRNDNLWNNASYEKTIYDPCPAGFKVPYGGGGADSPWYGLTSKTFESGDNAGYTWGTSYWPAAGYRGTDGTLAGQGEQGHYWGARYLGTSACYLKFSNGEIKSEEENDGYRAYGLSVRCVKEVIN